MEAQITSAQAAYNTVMSVVEGSAWIPSGPTPERSWIPGGYPKDTTGCAPWIGDFPPVPNPYAPQIVPYIPYDPPFVPGQGNSTIILAPPDPWRVNIMSDRIIASVDAPGMKLEELRVEIENGTIKVTGQRFDTRASVSMQRYVGTDYDPMTASAVLEAGVLTITVIRFKGKTAHQVPVTAR